MVNPDKGKFITSFTRRAHDGLFREILVPIKIRIPSIFPNVSHDLVDVEAIWDTGATNSVISDSLAQKMNIPPTGMMVIVQRF